MVKNTIAEFHGTIKITSIRKLKITQHGCEDGDKFQGFKGEFFILGDYSFSENKEQNLSGIFNGAFRSDFFLDKNNKVRYDDIEFCSDGYTNNQFVGQWQSYNGSLTKRCNWGDFRIPNSGDFDIGAGEFSPSKYIENGWQNIKKEQQLSNAEYKWWK